MGIRKVTSLTDGYAVVDLFCGVGGLSYGFKQEGFIVAAGIDVDTTCQYAYEKNISGKFYGKDLSILPKNFVRNLFPKGKKKILIGCAPCQAFSTYSQKYKDNDKWMLLYIFSEIIQQVQPDIISMENVPNLQNYKDGEVLKDFIDSLNKLNYKINWQIVDASEYGVPQNRKRLILFASKENAIKLVPPTHKNKKSVRSAIGKLPPIEDGETHPNDPLHRARKLSPLNKQRIEATPIGGSWSDWPEELILDCHKKDSGKSFGSVYGRMSWDGVAPTMTTQCTGLGNGRFGHPDQNRAISVREAAIFQSFPKKFIFYNPKNAPSYPQLELHIGNAVPARLGRIVARSIKNYIKEISNN